MVNNIYLEVSIPNPNMALIYDIAIQSESSMKKSLDGKYGFIRLIEGNVEDHGILQNATVLTHKEAVALRISDKYTLPD